MSTNQPNRPDAPPVLDRLHLRVERLLKAYRALQSHAHELELANENMKKELASKNQQIKDFQYQSEISKIVNSVAVEGGSREDLRNKLDEYIREIDDCINFLNQEEL